MNSLAGSSIAIVLTNPKLDDNPIVYVNDAFERLTGYSRGVAIGQNCRFLQGPETDPQDTKRIRTALERGEEVAIDILNYRSNGEKFTNRLLVTPVRDDHGKVNFFVGVQKALPAEATEPTGADAAMREIQHRVKNHLAMIVSLIRIQSREAVTPEALANIARRVQSLQLLYEELAAPSYNSNREEIEMGAYLTRVANTIAHIDGRTGVRVNIASESVQVPVEAATRLGLILSEVMTNAMQHAFIGRDTGLLEVRLSRLSGGGLRLMVSDDGVGLPKDMQWPSSTSLGGRIVNGLIEGLSGSLSMTRGSSGTIVTVDMPGAASH
ncbi:histidine kinase [Brevirhabdus pacifica]|uniref:histidine kinase n=2 Tax=Brevirhabdus pacifica TaxID=1267768 RepID=A0A1U7DLX2_9RHOB|nr:histidine kinase [Brevirhabdus pacifica]